MSMFTSIKKKAKKYTRRVLEGVHHSEDNQASEKEFNDLFAHFCDIEKHLQRFHDHVEDYVTTLRDTCTLEGSISGDLLYFFDAKSQNRQHADVYHNICTKLHMQRWSQVSQALKESVLDPLEKHLSLFPAVKEMVKKRKRKLADVKSCRRQVLHLAKTGKAKNPEKFKRKSDKLSQAERIFDQIHGDLLEVLHGYETSREAMLVEYTWKIMHAQQLFLSAFNDDKQPLTKASAAFKENAANGNSQVEQRLEEMVDLFKSGEYASDAANTNVLSPGSIDYNDPAADSKTASPRRPLELRKSTEPLQCYLNPPFDVTMAFEQRHRMWAPSDKLFVSMKEAAARSGQLKEEEEEGKRSSVASGPSTSSNYNNQPQEGGGGRSDRHQPEMVLTVYSYDAKASGELSFRSGETITVIKRSSDGWWVGRRSNGDDGTFPCIFTRPLLKQEENTEGGGG
mmetsp:Transcript_8817/g.13940  ORF Transcript_8817/g.13940 Transcript_8817/m.13940 type:complete len:453 (-) Transcript_8817:9-1367(-)